MTVIRTDKWLLDYYEKPVELCRKLKAQFHEDARPVEIHQHLGTHGMYQRPPKDGGDEWIGHLQENGIWQIVRKEERRLQNGGMDRTSRFSFSPLIRTTVSF